MTRFNDLPDNREIEKFDSALFSIVDAIRGRLHPEEYDVILLLLSLYRDKLLNVEVIENISNTSELLETVFDKSLDSTALRYRPVSAAFDSIDLETLRVILESFEGLKQYIFSDEYPSLFDSFLYQLANSKGRLGGEYLQPKELTKLVSNIVSLTPNAKIFNPFAGVASFQSLAKQNVSYFGQELNHKTWALGTLRAWAHNASSQFRYKREESIQNWPVAGEKFDLIVTNPPFGLKISNLGIPGKFISKYRTVEQFILDKSPENLSENGKVVTFMPQGTVLRQNGSEHILANLIESNLLDTIVSLPAGILKHTGIPFAMVILSKDNSTGKKVRFIKADKYVKVDQKGIKVLDYYSLAGLINGQLQDSESLRVVDKQQIRDNDFDLNILKYFKKEIEVSGSENLVKLSDILEYVGGKKGGFPDKGKYIRIRDLRDDTIDYKLDISDIEISDLSRPGIVQVKESCLLVATRWKTLKPTLFKFEGSAIYRSPDILSFKFDVSIVDFGYLINELNADYVQEQIEAYRSSGTVPFIRKDDFLKVYIKLPPLNEQKAKADGAKRAYIQAKEKELLLEKEITGVRDDSFREFASVKHTFRQYLSALKSNVLGTKKFISNKNGTPISLNDLYSNSMNQTLEEHLSGLEDTITSMGKLLGDFDGKDSTRNVFEIINLFEIIKNAQARFYSDIFDFEMNIDEYTFNDGEEILEPLIRMSREDFIEIFSNIVSNAKEHGFSNRTGNIIRTSISYDVLNEKCVIEISNNGKPIPQEFTLKHLTTKGEKTTDSTGSGIGGAIIKSILSKYSGTLDLINEPSSMFPVTYKICFPIQKSIEE